MTKTGLALLGALAVAGIAGAAWYVADDEDLGGTDVGTPAGPAQVAIDEAVDAGAAEVTVTGVDLENITFTVSGSSTTQVVIPAGLLLASSDPATQNMMTAQAVVVDLQGTPDAPDVQAVTVPVYCVNHSLAAPTPVSSFTLGTVTVETEPVQRLAQCLAGIDADHRQKQLAIWSVSDGYARLDADAFVQQAVDETREKMRGLGPDGVADLVQLRIPDADPQLVALIRAMSPDRLALVIEDLLPGLKAEKLEEFEAMRAAAGPLLAQCGYDVGTLPMFAGTP